MYDNLCTKDIIMSTTSRPFFLMTSPVLDHPSAGCLVADPALCKMMDFVEEKIHSMVNHLF